MFCVYLYTNTSMHGSEEHNHIMITYNGHSHMHKFVHEKILETQIAFFVIALVLHRYTQRSTREHQLLASSTKRWLKNLNHTYQSISITGHLTLVHITRLY